MLELKNIVKQYLSGENTVNALDGVSLRFRKSEFVSILGKSGCGKTTLLNIIGGLDRYTSGDLIINGKSTKEYHDGDWDVYRNRSIGFVFQSYNLIPHQTVLANVELALTLSGVSKAERRERAKHALEMVGLGDQLKKKPSQMSGGQMQRVAIARALVNDPDILLADEPTGALDSHTSVQIMDILAKVAKNKLVIMVTHNPDLAKEYSTRIVRLSDGEVIDDSDPYVAEESESAAKAEALPAQKKQKKVKKKPLTLKTALSLSLNNLMTKKARTILTSFAGSIGIIGIALILSLSNGIQAYITRIQEDTLSTYPLTISATTQDYAAMLSAMTEVSQVEDYSDSGKIYVDDSMGTMVSSMSSTVSNDLVSFKKHLEEHYDKIKDSVSDVQYTYDFDLQVYTEDGKVQVNPTKIFDSMGDAFSGMTEMMEASSSMGMGGMGIMSEMINNRELLDLQYELVGEDSRWPENANEMVLVVSRNNQISKMTLYMLGVLDQSELEDIMKDLMMSGEYDTTPLEPYEFSDFIGRKFKLVNTADYFEKTDKTYTVDGKTYNVWKDLRDEPLYDSAKFATEKGTDIVISGIVRPKEGTAATSISGALGYTKALTDHILEENAKSEIIAQQKETPNVNVLTGLEFERRVYTREDIGELIAKIPSASMEQFYAYMTAMIRENEEFKELLKVDSQTFVMFATTMSDDEQKALISEMLENVLAQPMGEMMLNSALFPTLKQIGAATGGLSSVDLTADNVTDLLPLLSTAQRAILFAGMEKTEEMPYSVPGLNMLCSEEFITAKYAAMNENIDSWEINEKSFLLILENMTDDEMFKTLEETLYGFAPNTDATYDSSMKLLGNAEAAAPASINFFAKDFASKEIIEQFIADYNDSVEEEKEISYTDVVGIMMSSISTIIDVISYVLIAFVSISLVVSSIMIGIITYISVLERTKEIGILRSIGASKKDISRVFNAETLIVGLTAGIIGIGGTLLLCIPINAIIHALTGIPTINAVLPVAGGIVLIIISMLLTFIAGLIPSGLAAKKDPVEALRSE